MKLEGRRQRQRQESQNFEAKPGIRRGASNYIFNTRRSYFVEPHYNFVQKRKVGLFHPRNPPWNPLPKQGTRAYNFWLFFLANQIRRINPAPERSIRSRAPLLDRWRTTPLSRTRASGAQSPAEGAVGAWEGWATSEAGPPAPPLEEGGP